MKKSNKPAGEYKNYVFYSSLVLQMGIVIALGTYGGIKLDARLNCSPLFTLIGSLGSIALSLYLVIKDLKIKDNEKNGKNSH